MAAIQRSDLAQVKTILVESPELADDYQHDSPLRTAASLGNVEICRYLIDQHHVDVNDFQRGNGYPIIVEALNHPQVMRLLIENNADLRTRITWRGDRTGCGHFDNATVLHKAATRGRPETIAILIDSGVDVFAEADLDGGNSGHPTALEAAVSSGRLDNARAIVSHPKFNQADRPLRQRALDNALSICATPEPDPDNPKLVNLLLEAGANPDVGPGQRVSTKYRILLHHRWPWLQWREVVCLIPDELDPQ